MGVNPIEDLVYFGMLGVLGDPIFMGLFIVGFFGAFVIAQSQTNTSMKIAVFVPAVLLAAAFIPFLALVIGLVVGFIAYLGLMKLIRK